VFVEGKCFELKSRASVQVSEELNWVGLSCFRVKSNKSLFEEEGSKFAFKEEVSKEQSLGWLSPKKKWIDSVNPRKDLCAFLVDNFLLKKSAIRFSLKICFLHALTFSETEGMIN